MLSFLLNESQRVSGENAVKRHKESEQIWSRHLVYGSDVFKSFFMQSTALRSLQIGYLMNGYFQPLRSHLLFSRLMSSFGVTRASTSAITEVDKKLYVWRGCAQNINRKGYSSKVNVWSLTNERSKAGIFDTTPEGWIIKVLIILKVQSSVIKCVRLCFWHYVSEAPWWT